MRKMPSLETMEADDHVTHDPRRDGYYLSSCMATQAQQKLIRLNIVSPCSAVYQAI